MMVRYNYPLRKHNTFGIAARTERYISLATAEEATDLLMYEDLKADNCLILGGGSNILFTKDFKGTIIQPAFNNIKIEEVLSDYVIISAEAGLEWDKMVEWTVNNNLGGLENLSLIPGNVGAAPIQNIGAYGAEVSDQITKVHAISIDNAEYRVFHKKDCSFGYRTSIFKNELKGKYLITKVEFRLRKSPVSFNLTYSNLEQKVRDKEKLTLAGIREAIIRIRMEKLPDPTVTGNAGSFFKNPVIDANKYSDLKKEYPEVPSCYIEERQYKIPAAWLIEKAGWKGKKQGRTGVHENHALVLVNLGNASGNEIMELSNMIIESVQKMFGIKLIKEVNVI